jgi:hypothetical protein
MGGVRVMVMTNTRPESETDASHVLMFAEAPSYSPSQAATPAGRAVASKACTPARATWRGEAADGRRSGAILARVNRRYRKLETSGIDP